MRPLKRLEAGRAGRLWGEHGLEPTDPAPSPGPKSCLFSTALCPNVVTQRRLATLRYLCYKRLVEVGMPGRGRWGAPGKVLSGSWGYH